MSELLSIIYGLPAFYTAIVFHEYAHAVTADYLGDPTARRRGRVTLNPVPHIDPLGLIMLVIFKFGWAKPVPVNPARLRRPDRDILFVSAAGPLANVVTALVVLILVVAFEASLSPVTPVGRMLFWLVWINIYLAVFNLIPVPPLDGSKILKALLPGPLAYRFDEYESVGWVLLILLLATGMISRVLVPAARWIYDGLVVLAAVIGGM